ncbi:DUF4364 family protein [Peptostreptococcus russellii]|uniref:DUF4364 domain-containing protein n=1 Tax=Peptostreptococcus russellii TaxID=215200 RepID=A0A1H8HRX8_9FIRM|nr:DUF4364 family protein [Peptostreptococcus russellii]MBC2578514.1 DUF4364 family protein [Peptostreptococcus russellii]SEN58871.1 protein of unknown function [Peptostreptococcus russellii]
MFPNSTDDLILEKLIVLYILNNLEEDVTDSQLTQIISKTDVMNYFTLMVILQKMIESKFIMCYTKNNRTLYAITQSGLEVLVYFQNRIPDFFIEKIDKYLKESSEEIYSSVIKKQSSYSLQGDSSYAVTLIIIEGRKNVMTINMSVDSEVEAKELCKKWNHSYRDKYTEILDILNV